MNTKRIFFLLIICKKFLHCEENRLNLENPTENSLFLFNKYKKSKTEDFVISKNKIANKTPKNSVVITKEIFASLYNKEKVFFPKKKISFLELPRLFLFLFSGFFFIFPYFLYCVAYNTWKNIVVENLFEISKIFNRKKDNLLFYILKENFRSVKISEKKINVYEDSAFFEIHEIFNILCSQKKKDSEEKILIKKGIVKKEANKTISFWEGLNIEKVLNNINKIYFVSFFLFFLSILLGIFFGFFVISYQLFFFSFLKESVATKYIFFFEIFSFIAVTFPTIFFPLNFFAKDENNNFDSFFLLKKQKFPVFFYSLFLFTFFVFVFLHKILLYKKFFQKKIILKKYYRYSILINFIFVCFFFCITFFSIFYGETIEKIIFFFNLINQIKTNEVKEENKIRAYFLKENKEVNFLSYVLEEYLNFDKKILQKNSIHITEKKDILLAYHQKAKDNQTTFFPLIEFFSEYVKKMPEKQEPIEIKDSEKIKNFEIFLYNFFSGDIKTKNQQFFLEYKKSKKQYLCDIYFYGAKKTTFNFIDFNLIFILQKMYPKIEKADLLNPTPWNYLFDMIKEVLNKTSKNKQLEDNTIYDLQRLKNFFEFKTFFNQLNKNKKKQILKEIFTDFRFSTLLNNFETYIKRYADFVLPDNPFIYSMGQESFFEYMFEEIVEMFFSFSFFSALRVENFCDIQKEKIDEYIDEYIFVVNTENVKINQDVFEYFDWIFYQDNKIFIQPMKIIEYILNF